MLIEFGIIFVCVGSRYLFVILIISYKEEGKYYLVLSIILVENLVDGLL